MSVVKSVELRNFRSHEEFLLDCNKTTTLIIGENGSGKTSILEAIYLCLRGKSFRGVDSEMMKRGAEYYRVELLYVNNTNVVVRYGGVREFEADGKKTRRLEKKRKYPVVLFEPDDLYLVGSSPSRRRDYFDRLLTQMNADYGAALGKYNKALKQRNDILKSENIKADDIFAWDVLLAKYGTLIGKYRGELMDGINSDLTGMYRNIAKNSDECEILYENRDGGESRYLAELNSRFERDRMLGHTTFGAHLDDYVFWFNGKAADGSASRGEVRSVILALKFIEASMLEKETGKNPVVLLDDIFSELDDARQKQVINHFKKHQVIISGTNVPKELGEGVRL